MHDALLALLEERKRQLSEQIKERVENGQLISKQLLARFNATAAHYETARQRSELEIEKARGSARPTLAMRVRLSVEDYVTLKEAARRQHRPTASLARMILSQWAIRKREDEKRPDSSGPAGGHRPGGQGDH